MLVIIVALLSLMGMTAPPRSPEGDGFSFDAGLLLEREISIHESRQVTG